MIVYKFGGASVKDPVGIQNLERIVSCAGEPLFVVVSAIGKTTNMLEAVVRTLFEGHREEAMDLLERTVIAPHKLICAELSVNLSHIDDGFRGLYDSVLRASCGHGQQYDKVYDSIVSYGEILSTLIVNAYLQQKGHDAKWLDMRQILRTDSSYREANVLLRESEVLLKAATSEAHSIYVSQGFIGANSQNDSTTLGREGSDYSAALVGNMLDANSVTIWKDVPGILNADPRVMQDAVLIPELTYYDAVELAYSGAQVIHPKTIRPLENKSIPLYVKPFASHNAEGTKISGTASHKIDIPIVIERRGLVLITIRPLDFSFVMEESLPHIFAALQQHNLKVSMIQSSAVTVSIAVNASGRISEAIDYLRASYRVSYNDGLSLLTIRQTNSEIEGRLAPCSGVLLEQRTRKTVKYLYKGNF